MNRKKIAAGFISFALMMQSCVFAVSAAEENKTANFEYDDFSVSYSVTNSYGNTEVVSLTLTNTGDETIEDWMLYFEPNGNIQYVTNATEMTAENGKMYFKNNGYNADIAPSSAVTFTYAVNDCTEIPDYYALCQTRVEKTEGYDVSLSVGESWGDSFNGSIVITNHTDKPIEAWELSIDTNFTITEISNSWAATVTELDEYQYLLKGTYTSTIAANSSVSLGFIGVKSGEPEISSYSLTEVKEDTSKMGSSTSIENIKLSASTKDLLTTDDGKVYFYAKPAYDDVHEINLVDASNGIVLATMYDDGDYENHGDDLENDGVFSCVVTVDNAVEAQLSFYAEDGANKSSDFIIDVYEDISDESIDEMIAVNNALETFSESDEYKNLTFEERVDAIKNLLKQLSETGTEEYPHSLIVSSSITFDKNSNLYSFMYNCKITGFFEVINEEYSETVGMASSLSNENDKSTELDESTNNENNSYLGTAKIIYDLNVYDRKNSNFSYSLFKSYAEKWSKEGLNTTITADHSDGSDTTSIEELKNLSSYDYVVIAAHGADNNNNPLIAVSDPGNNENYKRYKKDLRSGRIVPYGESFCVVHSFFERYYEENELNDTLFFFYSCDIFGENDIIGYNMYDSLHSVGAETVVGFCNELHAGYGNDMLTDFTQQMIYGHTTGEAFNYANTKNKSNYTEIPVIAGNINKSWANATVKNGDFESNDSSPRYWNYSGDVRILDSLGSYVHDNNLLFMSTGIGSKSDYNSSQVSQVFHIPENATTLTFSYNFISEEPMEWVGDEYDDEFLTNIYAGTSTGTVLRESTNTSTWHRTNITNFYGGDNTMYETQWKTVTIDVEQYAGKAIKLEFNVNNVGDNTYNSAVLIDNVLVA